MTMDIFSFVEGIGTIQAVLLILGLILLIVEIFTPGFGVAGGSGLLLLIIGISLTARNLIEAGIMLIILLALVAIGIVIILRSAKNGRLSRKLILHTASKSKDGYSTSDDNSALVGVEGVALTTLRPAGTGEFDGQRLDVVTEGDFIAGGVKIRIIRTEGRRIVVEVIEEVK